MHGGFEARVGGAIFYLNSGAWAFSAVVVVIGKVGDQSLIQICVYLVLVAAGFVLVVGFADDDFLAEYSLRSRYANGATG